jgi:hypothetical protein
MTNQRKIFGALLTLAASAFGVDHWWLRPDTTPAQPPANVQAHAPGPRRSPSPGTPGAGRGEGVFLRGPSQKPTTPAPASRTLAARLLDAARAEQAAVDDEQDVAPVPDAFRPSSLWYPAATTVAATAPADPVLAPEKIAEFRSRHRLTAIMKSSGPRADGSTGGLAIIGGRVYSPGQVIDGFTLVSLGDRTAQLTCKGVSIQLAIDPPDALTSLSGQ